jgi:hypothetical protein
LLKEVGEAVANLNTMVVGLDAVEKGHQKPPTLNISWNPIDRVSATRKARKFILESALVRVVESFSQFISALSTLRKFDETRAAWRGNTSLSEKASAISKHAIGKDHYLISATVLLIHWRNRIIHTNSHAKLTSTEENVLREAGAEIEKSFSGLKIEITLSHFKAQIPTLKDISSLISMCIRSAREIDRATFKTLSKDDLDSLMSFYGINSLLAKVKTETRPEKIDASIRRVFESIAPKLLEDYLRHYHSISDDQSRP